MSTPNQLERVACGWSMGEYFDHMITTIEKRTILNDGHLIKWEGTPNMYREIWAALKPGKTKREGSCEI